MHAYYKNMVAGWISERLCSTVVPQSKGRWLSPPSFRVRSVEYRLYGFMEVLLVTKKESVGI